MNIYSIVYQLVIDNDCVIVPNFGGFVANDFAAEIDFAKQEFYPPTRKIAFNESLSTSDGLLINHIAKTENIQWSDADVCVKKFVEDIKAQLADGQVVTFDKIGTFVMTGDCMIFSPFDQQLNSFLPAFNFPMLHSENGFTVQPPIVVEKNGANKNPNKKKTTKIISISTSVAAVIAGFMFLSMHFNVIDKISSWNTNDSNVTYAGVVVDATTSNDDESAICLDELIEEQEVVVEEAIEETAEEVAEEVAPEVVEVVETTKNNVHIIAGCFSNIDNANNVKVKLSELGLNSQILPIHNGLYRVSVKSFENTKAAMSELAELKTLTGNDALWILNF